MDDRDNLYIEAKNLKSEHTRKGSTPKAKKIKVRGSVEVARDNYRASKKMHKAQIRQLKRSIKAHKLEIRQAKGNYKLIKLNDKK